MYPAKRSKQGLAAIDVLIVIAFTALWFLSISLVLELTREVKTQYILSAIIAACFAVVVIGLTIKAKTDNYSASAFTAGMSLIIAVTMWVIVIGEGQVGKSGQYISALAAAIAASISTVFGFIWLLKVHQAPEPFPNILFEKFDKRKIYESKGVQFALESPGVLEAGSIAYMRFHIQNCWDTPRTVTLTLDGGKGLTYPGLTQITLEGLAAGIMHIPFAAQTKAKKRNQLKFNSAVVGRGGKRLRKKRGKDVSTSGAAIAAGLLFGVLGALLVKSGITAHIQITPHPNPNAAETQIVLPPVSWEEIFKPEAHHFIKPIG